MNYEVVDQLIRSGRSISTMESCTGGLLASTITDRSGASEIMKGAFVTYSNEAKIMQGVSAEIIETYGVYSIQTAEAMARACAEAYQAEIGVGITGSLGRKDPNNPDSVTGQVYYSIMMDGKYISYQITIPDDITERVEMKRYIVENVLRELKKKL